MIFYWSIFFELTAHAQVPPPLSGTATGTCGALCDLTTTLVNGGAVFAGLAAFTMATVLHLRAVKSAANSWSGKPVSWLKVWLSPLFMAALTVVVCAAILLGLGIAKADFLTLLLLDWQQPLGAALWLAALIGGVGGAPTLASVTSGTKSLASDAG